MLMFLLLIEHVWCVLVCEMNAQVTMGVHNWRNYKAASWKSHLICEIDTFKFCGITMFVFSFCALVWAVCLVQVRPAPEKLEEF